MPQRKRLKKQERSATGGKLNEFLGILSLARNESAYFNVRAVTDVTVVEIGSAELEAALRRSSTLAGLFVSVLLRSLVRRNRRGAEMRLEINRLADELRAEEAQRPDPRPVVLPEDVTQFRGKPPEAIQAALEVIRAFPGARVVQ